MSVESVGGNLQNVGSSRIDKKDPVSKESKQVKHVNTKDRIELSKKAKMMKAQDDLIREAVDLLDELPDEKVRSGLIKIVQQRLEEDYYDQEDVMEEVIRSMQELLL